MLLSIANELSAQENFSVDLSKPAYQLISLKRLSICFGNQATLYFLLQRRKLAEKTNKIALKPVDLINTSRIPIYTSIRRWHDTNSR